MIHIISMFFFNNWFKVLQLYCTFVKCDKYFHLKYIMVAVSKYGAERVADSIFLRLEKARDSTSSFINNSRNKQKLSRFGSILYRP